ncbi:MAG TPA: hypothetical protein VF937_14190 [Chloroflexota bacterium]
MMSSVIPARLQFQCGHSALVTLPRIKGETFTQRNERVAREKSAALSRRCDFCGPVLEVVAAPRLELVVPPPSRTAEEVAVPNIVALEPPTRPEPAIPAEPVRVAAAVAPVRAPEPARANNGVAHLKPLRARRPRKVSVGQEFRVEFQVERVLQAVSIHDALRQVAAMGAAEVLAITREN